PSSGEHCGKCGGYDSYPPNLTEFVIGNGTVHYCECVGGCCAPTIEQKKRLQTGTFPADIHWSGHEWNGVDDTGIPPEGPVFAPGSYTVDVSITVPGVGRVVAKLPIEISE